MKQYIKSLEIELNQNEKLKDIENDVKTFKTVELRGLLLKLGYEKDEVKSFVEASEKYKSENGELQISNSMLDSYASSIREDVISSAVTKNKEIIFLLGLPGSGKSSSLELISNRYGGRKFYLIDADIFKEGKEDSKGNDLISPLTDKNKGGIDVESVHEASSELAKFFTELLSGHGFNLALPKIGDNIDKIRSTIGDLKNKGYKVYIHFLYTKVETALERNLQRFLHATSENERRRLVPAKYIYEVGYRPLYNFFTSN